MTKVIVINGKSIVVPKLLERLPFYDALDWQLFQTLCADLMFVHYNTPNCREYLRQGYKQEGIDVYACETGSHKLIVAQCKLKSKIQPNEIDKIIDLFLKGTLSEITKEFIICTNFNLGDDKKVEQKLIQADTKLKEKGITLKIWDEKGLSLELRNNTTPGKLNIVNRYFGRDVALHFYGEVWKQWLKKITEIPKIPRPAPVDHIPRTLTLYANQQSEDEKHYLLFDDKERDTLVSLIENRLTSKTQRLVLLSTAGFGKTEEIKNVARFYSTQDNPIYPIPFFLRDYQSEDIESIISKAYDSWRELPEENLLLLFDGLDELQDKHYQLFLNHLNAFVVSHPQVNIVVSSRFNFYDLKSELLRGFEVYVLNQLTIKDIDSYLDIKLGASKTAFMSLLSEKKFNEYNSNPYYLTRLVRFYLDKQISFPNTKSELFRTILFDRLERDSIKYHSDDLEERLFPLAQKIAGAMTLMGRSSLSEAEMKKLVPDIIQRRELKQFGILNKNGQNIGGWSFEHKNLQEYLCANYLSQFSFSKLQEYIALPFDKSRLLPKLLNTVSFLFEQIPNESPLFTELFNWIQENQPELLIRFEKEQLSQNTREVIFKSVFNSYLAKGLSLYISSHFSIRELADFVGINSRIVCFLEEQLQRPISDRLAMNALDLLACCKKPFLVEAELNKVFFETLSNTSYNQNVHAICIDAIRSVGLKKQNTFEDILKSRIDLTYFDTRKALIRYLSYTDYYEQYDQFILDSISIFNDGQRSMTISGSTDMLKSLILKFTSAKSIKKLFQFFVADPDCVSQYHNYKKLHLELKELEELLKTAATLYSEESAILRLVYRLFNERRNAPYYDKWLIPFKDFFENTCGLTKIFYKLYKYGKSVRDITAFADQSCCDFLIDEYLKGKLKEQEIVGYRNVLSHNNYTLFEYFYEQLKTRTEYKFVIEDLTIDYSKIYKEYLTKNYEMLLNRDLFLSEAKSIFKILKKEKISKEDLSFWNNIQLRRFQYSDVLNAISMFRIRSDEKLVTEASFLKRYKQDEHWEAYVINKISNLLDETGRKEPLHPDLVNYANSYCINEINNTDFEGCVKDIKRRDYSYNQNIEFLRQLVLKLKPELSDHLLIKMLPCEIYGYSDNNDDKITLSQFIVERIKDKNALKTAVLANLGSGKLASLVSCTHFWIATKMGYTECLGLLYHFIIHNTHIGEYERRQITEFYLTLGGSVEDFTSSLKAPDPFVKEDAMYYSSWLWFLIENHPDKKITMPILSEILHNEKQHDENRSQACKLLIKEKQIEGLKFWVEYIKLHQKAPFGDYAQEVSKDMFELPHDQAIPLLIETLEYVYLNNLHSMSRFQDELDRPIYEYLNGIAAKGHVIYLRIKGHLDRLATKYKNEPFGYTILHYSERLTQQFYANQDYSPNIDEANNVILKLASSVQQQSI